MLIPPTGLCRSYLSNISSASFLHQLHCMLPLCRLVCFHFSCISLSVSTKLLLYLKSKILGLLSNIFLDTIVRRQDSVLNLFFKPPLGLDTASFNVLMCVVQ
ncbi:hypothetical protein PC116_g18948 [Phytophthora cactorum]|nr:hypothetical protein PC116_g18948 [Phytophthora cactorum]